MHPSTPAAFTLITFASYWGSKYGGINAFNTDLLEAISIAYYGKVKVVCVVNSASDEDIAEAIADSNGKQVTLVPLPYEPLNPHQGQVQAIAAIDEMAKQGITFDPETTVWLGHDRITGQAALTAAKQAGGRSALIHHMSYDHYEAFAENAATANEKRNQQEALFSNADILMAVGPLLRDALEDIVDGEVNMIIPGLAAIEPKKKPPNTFSMFVSGRLSKDASKIKQGQLAVAAFADSYKQAKQQGQPEAILKRPKLLMRGVDFDLTDQADDHYSVSEENLQKFAEGYADAVINLQPLPYTTDRQQLFKDLKSASVAAMPSWHEGFGLVGWEAIAAGVPLILSKDSGVYELIAQYHNGFQQSHVWAVDINGKTDDPYFSDKDLATVSEAIKQIAQNPATAREKAQRLKQQLSGYTWDQCAKDVAVFFDWQISEEEQAAASNTSTHLKHIRINGFKSIHSLDLEMGAINILIGANGAGKSNFISLFTFLRNLSAGKLQNHVEKQGFADTFFHFGAKHTAKISIDLTIGNTDYHVEFSHGVNNDNLVFEQEFCTDSTSPQQWQIKQTSGESGLAQPVKLKNALTAVLTGKYLNNCRVYHFHDTGANAGFKKAIDLDAADYLYDDASNIAALLYRLKNEYPRHYQRILAAIQTVTPFFHDFYLEPRGEAGNEKLILKWIHREHDMPFSANQLSDGTARFICMATLFLQPQQLQPNTIIIDEPELGLHPTALEVLADMVKLAAKSSQVICSTQSVTFANKFEPEHFIVVDQKGGASEFKRPDLVDLEHWLDDFCMGDIWHKNLVGGGPQW